MSAPARDDRQAVAPMRLLYLADIRCPLERANGIQTFETCHALAARGHHVTLLVRDDTARPRRDPFQFYGLPHLSHLSVVRLRLKGPLAARRALYLTIAALRAARWPRDGCVMTRDLGAAAAVLRLPRLLRPKLVYESHGFSPVFAETKQELVSGAKPGSSRKLQRLTRREQRVWERADGYVTTTGVLATELRGRFGERRLVTTIPNGVRLPADRKLCPPLVIPANAGIQDKNSEAGRRLTRDAVPCVIGYAGHLYPWKGVDVLIRAIELLPDARALIIGGFPTEPDLDRAKRLAAELVVDDRIEFTGQVEPARVPALLAEADILVLPTVATASAVYTSPLKLFEYFAAGRPIVSSDLPPVREIVRDGENGLLFEAGNPGSLAAAIRRVQADSQLAERLARTAFGEADEYGWSRRAERLEDFLVSVMRRES